MNAERRVQRVRAALRPVGESKPDWQIVAEVAREMGAPGFVFTGPEAIWDEVRSVCDGGRGMTYGRLELAGLQWPCPSEAHPGTSILHVDRFSAGAKVPLQRVDFTPSPEQTSADYPFALITGRSLYQFNAGTMTLRTRNTELRPHDWLDVSPADAASLGVRDGDRVQIASRYGRATLPVRISDSVQGGQVYATFQTVDGFLNAVTGPNRDAVTGTEYKVTAVQIRP